MDINAKDRQYLQMGICPDCKSALFKKLFDGIEKQVCFRCNTWFEIWGGGNVVRNLDANKHCMQTEDEPGNRWEGLFDITN